jgi:hypothetical protein
MRQVTLSILLALAAMAGALPTPGVAPARAVPTHADSVPPLRPARLASPVVIDGSLDDAAWRVPPTLRTFTQAGAFEGQVPRESTWVWLAYDDDALVVAARCWDAHPESMVVRLVRRDTDTMVDYFEILLDPFHDHRSGYYFAISAAGVLYDAIGFNDGWWDDTWDGVWSGRARRQMSPRDGAGMAGGEGTGWTCEERIPFSQLRYRPGTEQVWGVDPHRFIARHNEDDFYVYTPRAASGTMSRWAHLVGLENGHRARAMELSPYVTGKGEYLAHGPGDPFNDGSRHTTGLGADLRMAVGNNLTLNATANPDFGQVEVDPAVVNLSDVESYFEEKRPFFTENSRVFSFGNEGANDYWGFNWPGPTVFYSRRVGRAPQGGAPPAEYADVPVATRILGAAKLTGKLTPSVNFGMMHAFTAREEADVAAGGLESRAEVEPLTYYGVMRGLKEFRERRHGLGTMVTLAQRRFDAHGLEALLNRQSLVAGLDGWHFLDRRQIWVLSGWAGMTRLAGARERMIAVQNDPRHYLQRPDVSHLGVDSTATSLTGYGARMWLHRQEGGFLFNSAVGLLSPKFDVNDMGYQSRADVVNAHLGMGYAWNQPNRWWRRAWTIGALYGSRDFGGNLTAAGFYGSSEARLVNNTVVHLNLNPIATAFDNRRTRGGPRVRLPGGFQSDLSLSTDATRHLAWGLDLSGLRRPAAGTYDWSVGPSVTWKPVPSLALSVGPSYERTVEDAQYVTSVLDPGSVPADFGGRRYVFARLDQRTLAANIRFNVSLTPDLSLQTYLQPLISAGRYTDFKELARARSYDFIHYGETGAPVELPDPSFNFKSLRGNAVLRWEYRPGSVLYFVWTQQRTDVEPDGELRFGPSTRRLFDAAADDVFMVKATYYLDL